VLPESKPQNRVAWPPLQSAIDWKPDGRVLRIVSLDAHTGGEPLRIFLSGIPEIPGSTILERRRFASENLEHLRTALMWEPHGHADMYGCIVMPPATGDGDFGVLFTHNEGYSSMCGHGIIAVVTALLETGVLDRSRIGQGFRIDTPAGRILATAQMRGDRVQSVSFENVPSYVVELDAMIAVTGLGEVQYDLAFGGAYYACVRGDQFDPRIHCLPEESERLIRLGRQIKQAVIQSREIAHPTEPDLGFLYGTIFTAPAVDASNHSRNCCVFADGEVDRSPTGTGVSGRAAIHFARGELKIGETIRIESILGSLFDVTVNRETSLGPHPAIVPVVTGQAFITGRHEFLIDPDDPLRKGFLLR